MFYKCFLQDVRSDPLQYFPYLIKGTPDPQCPLIQVFFIIRKKVDFSPYSANPHKASPFLPLPLWASLHSDYRRRLIVPGKYLKSLFSILCHMLLPVPRFSSQTCTTAK